MNRYTIKNELKISFYSFYRAFATGHEESLKIFDILRNSDSEWYPFHVFPPLSQLRISIWSESCENWVFETRNSILIKYGFEVKMNKRKHRMDIIYCRSSAVCQKISDFLQIQKQKLCKNCWGRFSIHFWLYIYILIKKRIKNWRKWTKFIYFLFRYFLFYIRKNIDF